MNTLKTHLSCQNQAPPSLPKPHGALRILHTSDWHLGKMLYHQPRYDEFEKFLDWLQNAMVEYQVDVLIVAGDIFDTMTPSNRAEQLYHQFLAKAFQNQIKHIIITAGNHDSPTSLNKTKEVLGVLNTHVIGSISDDMTDELIVLKDTDHTPAAIIMAVPYLRDRDVRSSNAQSIEQKNEQLLQGVADYYHNLAKLAKDKQQQISKTYQKIIPIIATGHLYAAGASISSKDDGMRDIQIGTLGQINANIFDDVIDYVALGHIHAAQKVAKQEKIRYCGSPIAMGFGEIGRQKQVLIVDLPKQKSHSINNNLNKINELSVNNLPVPIFCNLAKISGDLPFITESIDKLKAIDEPIWLEISYTGDELITDLKQRILKLTETSLLQAISIKNRLSYQGSLSKVLLDNPIQTLDEMDIFNKRLDKENLNDKEKKLLTTAYQSLLKSVHENDEIKNLQPKEDKTT